jgi:hypothetical protein
MVAVLTGPTVPKYSARSSSVVSQVRDVTKTLFGSATPVPTFLAAVSARGGRGARGTGAPDDDDDDVYLDKL